MNKIELKVAGEHIRVKGDEKVSDFSCETDIVSRNEEIAAAAPDTSSA